MAYVPQNFQSGDVLYASQLNEMDSQIERNEAAAAKRDFIAKDYDPTATYKKGDMAIYNGTVQVATVDIPVAEAFAPSHWKLTTVDERFKETLATKADVDGQYENLVAGAAEELISAEADTDTAPYVCRRSGGDKSVGKYEKLEKIVGGTVAWNQQVTNHSTTTLVKSTNRTASYPLDKGSKNNKYLVLFDLSDIGGTTITGEWMGVQTAGQGNTKTFAPIIGKNGLLFVGSSSISTDSMYFFIINDASASDDATVTISNAERFDLTTMFGPTIADYIYNLEQANAGTGVAWFRKLFPKDYYSYNPGELISVKTASHDMVGFNLWDEEWEKGFFNTNTGVKINSATRIRCKNPIKVSPSTTYYIKNASGTNVYCFAYDAKMNLIDYWTRLNSQLITPANCHYLNIAAYDDYGVVYKNDICINFSGSRNGEYEPYEKHSYPLADVELRGPLAIDENGKLVYSGDEYTPSGQIKRKYGFIDLGTATWSYNSTNGIFYSGDISHFVKTIRLSETANIICPKYETVAGIGYNGDKDKSISIGYMYRANDINIKDSAYTDADAFKAAMSGVMLVYELETPTTEQVAPYTPVQVVDDWGTEEFVDTREVAIPVGHSTSYMANLRDKLQHLPSLADEDGEYIVKQTGTKMELAKFSSVGAASAIVETTESLPVVSIKDGADGQPMRKVEVAIEPVQDLHGYDAPWPAGGGKNLLPTPAATSTESNGITWTVNVDGSVKVAGTATARSLFYYYNGGNEISLNNVKCSLATGSLDSNSIGAAALINGVWSSFNNATHGGNGKLEQVWFDVASGKTVNGTIYPMIMASSETDLSWSPYSNVCPISGWTGAKVTRTGKNLCEQVIQGFINQNVEPNMLTIDNDSESLVFHAVKGATYCFSSVVAFNRNLLGRLSEIRSGAIIEERALVPNGVWTATWSGLTVLYCYSSKNTSIESSAQIELGSTATAYEPYQGQTYEVAFPADPGTVYSGTLDVVTGKLVVDMAKVDLKQVDFVAMDRPANAGGGKCFIGNIATPLAVYPVNESRQKYSSGQIGDAYYASGNRCNAYQTQNKTYFRCGFADPNYPATIEEFNTWKQQQSAFEIAYVLASPIEYTLTPQEIKTLLGVNNIWADAGNTAITYLADTKTYIDRKIAEAVANALNS